MKKFLYACCAVVALAMATEALAQDANYTVKPGDLLSISVWKEPDLQRPALVRPDGSFSFPLVGEIDARGKTVADLNKTMGQKLAKYISDPVVTVSIQEIKGNKVYVIGQVNKPGEFIMNPTVDVMQALSMAGGTTPFAALAWTDRPAISFQFHPEFSPDFAKALIEKRYDVVPDPDAAIASLDAPNDGALVGGWIRRFLAD